MSQEGSVNSIISNICFYLPGGYSDSGNCIVASIIVGVHSSSWKKKKSSLEQKFAVDKMWSPAYHVISVSIQCVLHMYASRVLFYWKVVSSSAFSSCPFDLHFKSAIMSIFRVGVRITLVILC